jgi:hypothetical protein
MKRFEIFFNPKAEQPDLTHFHAADGDANSFVTFSSFPAGLLGRPGVRQRRTNCSR